jgi:hypothetical protein
MKGGAKKNRRPRQKGGNPTSVQEALRSPSTPEDLSGNGFGASSMAKYLTGEGVHTSTQPMTDQFKSTNMGLNWATNGGAKKSAKKRKSLKKSAEKVKRNMPTTKRMKQKGGVTPFPMRYFNPDHNTPTANNSSGESSAYGTIAGYSQPETNLAPFPNSSGQMTGGNIGDKYHISNRIKHGVNPLLDDAQSQHDAMNGKTGGAKRKSSKKKSSKTPVKKRSKTPVKKRSKTPVKKRSKTPVKKRSKTPAKKKSLFSRMKLSVKKAASKVKKALSPKRKSSLKPKRKQKGGGSDWRMTQYSRGAYDNPDMSESQFRAFNKSSAYIPNTKLWEFATPLLNNSNSNLPYGPAPVSQGGAGKTVKRKSPSKKSKTVKRKSPSKKSKTVKRKSPSKKSKTVKRKSSSKKTMKCKVKK